MLSLILRTSSLDASNMLIVLIDAGLTPAAVTRLEMVGLLCVMDRTHSQLIDAIPETCGVSHHDKDYESVIQQVSA